MADDETLDGYCGADPNAARKVLERGAAPVPVDASRAIELAYGLLWLAPEDTATKAGLCASLARQALLGQLDQAGKLRGVQLAMVMLAAAQEESRKNPRTETDRLLNYLNKRTF